MDEIAVLTLSDERMVKSSYVQIKMLRHHGYSGPILVYTREGQDISLLSSPGVEIRIAPGSGSGFAWTDRTSAMMDSPYRYIFHMDADVYPVGDITDCFKDVKAYGCVAWQDAPTGDRFLPEVYGLSPESEHNSYTPQCGTLMLDTVAMQGVINRVHEYCSDPYYFQFNPSWDQPQWRAAWLWEGVVPKRYSPNRVTVLHRGCVFLHQGRDGETPLLVHRTGYKFGIHDVRCDDLPGESLAWGFYEDVG